MQTTTITSELPFPWNIFAPNIRGDDSSAALFGAPTAWSKTRTDRDRNTAKRSMFTFFSWCHKIGVRLYRGMSLRVENKGINRVRFSDSFLSRVDVKENKGQRVVPVVKHSISMSTPSHTYRAQRSLHGNYFVVNFVTCVKRDYARPFKIGIR